MDHLSYFESAKPFSSAEVLVGPRSAGWASLLFSQRHVRALFWTWKDARGDNWHENIAGFSKSKWRQVELESAMTLIGERSADPRSRAYGLQPESFSKELRRLVSGVEA